MRGREVGGGKGGLGTPAKYARNVPAHMPRAEEVGQDHVNRPEFQLARKRFQSLPAEFIASFRSFVIE